MRPHFVWSWLCLASALAEDEDCTSNVFLQTARQRQSQAQYLWPSGRGRFPFFAVSEHTGPFKLNHSLAWSWHHPEGRFHSLTYGTVIDDAKNVYLSGADAMRKFDPEGHLLWEYNVLPSNLMNAPVIYEGLIFGSDTTGGLLALNMETGKRAWYTKLADSVCQDNGFNMVHRGVVFAAANCVPPSNNGDSANQHVKALNASTGELLWSYKPDMAVWNFLPLFPDEETLVFQDMTGKAYRMTLKGKLLWKVGGVPGTWTDGGAALGPNNLMYTVNNNNEQKLVMFPDPATQPGTLSAYDLNGNKMWHVTTPRPPNNAPAVGKVYGWDGLTLVMPLCQQVFPGATCDVHAYNANTGELRWVFYGPTQTGILQAGDLEGVETRLASGLRSTCLPNGWSAPTIAADGVVFIGSEEGPFFALRDADGDGRVLGENEVAAFETYAAFSGSSSAALAPGTVAVASCDSLFVFKS